MIRPDVTCPDWKGLVALRGREGHPEMDLAGWAEALDHLDACSRCRPEALEADPLLVFRRLPAPEMSAAEESAEVDSMRQAVTAMRTAKRLDSRRRFAGWRRWAAAAVLFLSSLALGHDRAPLESSMARMARQVPAPESMAATADGAPEPGTPMLEDLNRPNARVYQVQRKNLNLVWVVDKGFDV